MLAPLAILLLACSVSASPITRRQSGTALKPSADPFYTPDDGWDSSPPGTVLRNRVIQSNVGSADIQAWQLLYVSTQSNGTKMATVTTVFKEPNAGSDSIIGYSAAEDSTFIDCAPSYFYQKGTTGDAVATLDTPIFTKILSSGSVVVSSDYEGPNSAFGAGRQAGQGVLDGIRAAINFRDTVGLSEKPKIGFGGYSGGAIATGWAASLASSYAPELNIVGAAFGGTPANLAGTLRSLDGTLYAGLGFAGAAGLVASYPQLAALIDQIATQKAKDALAQLYSQCASRDVLSFSFQKLQSTDYTSLGDGLLDDPTVKSVTDSLIMGAVPSETPNFPIFVFHAAQDEVIPIADITQSVASWCSNGIASLSFVVKNGTSDHVTFGTRESGAAIDFITAQIAGTSAPVSGCVTTYIA